MNFWTRSPNKVRINFNNAKSEVEAAKRHFTFRSQNCKLNNSEYRK